MTFYFAFCILLSVVLVVTSVMSGIRIAKMDEQIYELRQDCEWWKSRHCDFKKDIV